MLKKKKNIDLSAKPGSAMDNKTGSWRTYKPVVNHEKCIGCGTCERVCPEGVCYKTGKKNKAGKEYYDNDLDYCKGCGICAEECPVKCIKIEMEEK
ncbi:MAG: 4Fe-4S binding protein [Patescibacteria group bacterium]|jgi:pyruvate ferredoxin oxidoreductase delta subunit